MSIYGIFGNFYGQRPVMIEKDTQGYTRNGNWTQKDISPISVDIKEHLS